MVKEQKYKIYPIKKGSEHIPEGLGLSQVQVMWLLP